MLPSDMAGPGRCRPPPESTNPDARGRHLNNIDRALAVANASTMAQKRASSGSLPPAKKSELARLCHQLIPVHSFFTQNGANGSTDMANGSYQKAPPSLLHYQHLDPLKEAKEKKEKVSLVLYDLDGTLIKPRNNGRFPKNREDWTWWHTSVPARLKEEAEAGKHIIILSNQGVTDKK